MALEILGGAEAAGATAARLAISQRTLQQWRRQFAGDGDGGDGGNCRKGSVCYLPQRLSWLEMQQTLAVCNESD